MLAVAVHSGSYSCLAMRATCATALNVLYLDLKSVNLTCGYGLHLEYGDRVNT